MRIQILLWKEVFQIRSHSEDNRIEDKVGIEKFMKRTEILIKEDYG